MAKRIVVGTDGSESALAAVAWAAREAASRGAELLIVHGWLTLGVTMDPTGSSYGPCETAGVQLLAEAERHCHEVAPDVPVVTKLVAGTGDAAVLDASDGAEMLVVGHRGHGSIGSALLGSVADRIVHHARCVVAVVR